MFIAPSSYYWFLPKLLSAAEYDKLAAQGQFPTVDKLFPALIYCFLFGIARHVLTGIAFRPLALYAMNLKFGKPDKTIAELDLYMSKNSFEKRGKRMKSLEQLVADASAANPSVKEKIGEAGLRSYVHVYRQNHKAEKKVVKFVEALWRGIFYTIFVGLGTYCLFYPEPVDWVVNPSMMWIKWPQPVSEKCYFYYQLALGCYLHQLMWTEVTRSDAMEMILHHLTTILLLLMSLFTQFTRVGTSILLVHDIADVFLESAKCFNYTAQNNRPSKRWAQPTCDILFGFFAVSFFVTRLIIFPRYLTYSLYSESPNHLGGIWPGYYGFVALLGTLQVLHVFWMYLVFKMIYKMFTTGIEKDERSDDEEDDDEAEGAKVKDKEKKKR